MAAIAVVVTVVIHTIIQCRTAWKDASRRQRAAVDVTRAAGAALWPLVLFSLVRPEDRQSQCLYPALVVVSMLWLLDATSDGILGIIEPQSLHGLFFGLSALVGSRPDAPHAQLFFYAVLIYMLFVLPTHDVPPDTFEHKLLMAIRRVATTWALGLLVAAGFLTRNCGASVRL